MSSCNPLPILFNPIQFETPSNNPQTDFLVNPRPQSVICDLVDSIFCMEIQKLPCSFKTIHLRTKIFNILINNIIITKVHNSDNIVHIVVDSCRLWFNCYAGIRSQPALTGVLWAPDLSRKWCFDIWIIGTLPQIVTKSCNGKWPMDNVKQFCDEVNWQKVNAVISSKLIP